MRREQDACKPAVRLTRRQWTFREARLNGSRSSHRVERRIARLSCVTKLSEYKRAWMQALRQPFVITLNCPGLMI